MTGSHTMQVPTVLEAAAFHFPADGCSMACMPSPRWSRQPLLSRRVFGRLLSCSAAGLYGAGRDVLAQALSQPTITHVMPQLSVMLWTLKAGRSFDERLEVVAKAGYSHVELVDEFLQWSNAEFARSLATMRTLGLGVDAMAGMKIGFADPARGDAFLAELQGLVAVAHRLQCPQIILLSGNRLEDPPSGRQHEVSLDTLRRAAELLRRENLTGVIEPIDRLENPAIYLDGVTEAFALTRAIASPHLRVLYDLYHEQRSQGNLIEKLEKNIDQVGLIHVADVPGRHEPGTGEIHFGNIYGALGRLGYKGVIAMEFYPTGDAVEALRRARLDAERGMQTPS